MGKNTAKRSANPRAFRNTACGQNVFWQNGPFEKDRSFETKFYHIFFAAVFAGTAWAEETRTEITIIR